MFLASPYLVTFRLLVFQVLEEGGARPDTGNGIAAPKPVPYGVGISPIWLCHVANAILKVWVLFALHRSEKWTTAKCYTMKSRTLASVYARSLCSISLAESAAQQVASTAKGIVVENLAADAKLQY